jgi:hypothetical protein
VHAAAGSLVLIRRMWTTCNPSLTPPPSPPPICLQSLTRDTKGAGVGRGRSRCWPSPVSCAPTELSHGSDPSNMSSATVIADGSPSPERTPLSEPQSQRCPCLTTTERNVPADPLHQNLSDFTGRRKEDTVPEPPPPSPTPSRRPPCCPAGEA